MKVRSETVIENRTISVELDAEDGAAEFPKWVEWKSAMRFRALSNKADQLVIFYLAQAHLIAPNIAQERMSSLKQAAQAFNG